MKSIRASMHSLLLIVVLVASVSICSAPAHATSDYDDLLHTTSTLQVYTDTANTQTLDIGESWWHDFKQAYATRVAQNIGWPTNFVSEFESIMATGGSWGVYSQIDTSSGGITVNIVGTRDPYASCGFVGSATSGTYQCSGGSGYGAVHAEYFTHNSFGGNGCVNTCSDNGMNIYLAPVVYTGSASYTFLYLSNAILPNYRFYFMNFNLVYPAGYDGELIPVNSTHLYYSGTIDCGGLEVQGIWINQEGNSGLASWSYESPHRATWGFPSNANPYTVVVGCGEELAEYGAWTTLHVTEVPLNAWEISNDWVCTSGYCWAS